MNTHVEDTPAEKRFREATETLYVCFGKYPKPALEYCLDPFDPPASDEARLAFERKELCEFTEDEWDYYVIHSLCHWSSREQCARRLKYWLPRLLDEMTPTDWLRTLRFDEWFVCRYMNGTDWHRWPRGESQAIRRWCERWLEACTFYPCGPADELWGSAPEGRRISLWIDFTTELELDLVSHFARLTAPGGPEVVRTICCVVSELAPELMQYHELGEVGFPTAAVHRSFLAWLMRPELGTRLEAAFFRFADANERAAREISEAVELLPGLRNSWLDRPGGPPDWLRDALAKAGRGPIGSEGHES